MIVVGLTGGIASGKSFVLKYLIKHKIPTHDSDSSVDDFYKKPSYKFLKYLIKEGFEEAIKNKKIEKKIIRDLIFNNKSKKNKLEKYLHNEVKIERTKFIKNHKSKKIVCLDIPLLFEKKLQSECNCICSTIAPTKIREKRALLRKNMNKKMFNLILQNQVSDKLRKEQSDYLIDTSGSKNKTCLQVDNIIYDILNQKIAK